MYSDIVMDHFNHPRNIGVIEDADGIGEVGNPVCGDMMTFYIKVKDNRLEDVKFQTFGCVAAIAVSSMVSEMAKGKDLEEAKKITNKQVAETLGGLPPNKLHCSNLGAEALNLAIKNYQEKDPAPLPRQPKEIRRVGFTHEPRSPIFRFRKSWPWLRGPTITRSGSSGIWWTRDRISRNLSSGLRICVCMIIIENTGESGATVDHDPYRPCLICEVS